MTIHKLWPFVHSNLKPLFTTELHLADTIHVDFLGSFYGVLISHGIESGCNLILYSLKAKIQGPIILYMDGGKSSEKHETHVTRQAR